MGGRETHDYGEDRYETLTGESYNALKYLPISRSQYNDQLMLYVELGWKSLDEAVSLHENDHYICKVESKISTMIQNKIDKISKKIKLFTCVIGSRIKQGN